MADLVWGELLLSVKVLIECQFESVISSSEKLSLLSMANGSSLRGEERQFQLLLQIIDFVGRCKSRSPVRAIERDDLFFSLDKTP